MEIAFFFPQNNCVKDSSIQQCSQPFPEKATAATPPNYSSFSVDMIRTCTSFCDKSSWVSTPLKGVIVSHTLIKRND